MKNKQSDKEQINIKINKSQCEICKEDYIPE